MSSPSSTIPSITTNGKDSSPVDIPYLPDELLLNCLARVSRLDYPSLFLVCKRFRSLLVSKELYRTRELLGCTESCLYVSILGDWIPYWFILCRSPTQIPNSNPKFTLVSTPSQDYFPTYGWDVISVGSDIYMIGGSNYSDNDDNDDPSSKVFIMDCRSHTWREAPSMRFARKVPSSSVLDGKIYVVGGVKKRNHLEVECNLLDQCNLLECFDTKKQKWEHVQCPSAYMQENFDRYGERPDEFKSLTIEGKLYLLGAHERVQVYKPTENRWNTLRLWMDMVLTDDMISTINYLCVVDKVLYGCDLSSKPLKWYDFEKGIWRVLNGVEELPEIPKCCYVRLVNYGGKLAVLWEEDVSDFWRGIGSNERKIWCAQISLERRNEQEIYGKIEWCQILLKVPKSCYLDKCIAVTV